MPFSCVEIDIFGNYGLRGVEGESAIVDALVSEHHAKANTSLIYGDCMDSDFKLMYVEVMLTSWQ